MSACSQSGHFFCISFSEKIVDVIVSEALEVTLESFKGK